MRNDFRVPRTMAGESQSAISGRDGGSSRPFHFPLRPYQNNGIQYLRRVNGCGALFWEMRLGKTITIIRFLSMRRDARRVLVCAPYSALAGWRDELINDGKKDAVHTIYRIKPADRARYLDTTSRTAGWYLVNKEIHLYCDVLRYTWDAVILDESWITNPKAKVTKYFLSRAPRVKYRILLSGTPAPETELQYYTQLYWINPRILGSRSYWDFRVRWCRLEGYDWVMTLRGKQFLGRAIAQACSVLKRTDVGLNKEKIFRKWPVELSAKTRKRYADAELGLLDGEVLKFAGEQWTALRRLCSGEEKEKELVALLRGDLKKDRVIIWANYVEEVERLSRLLQCQYIHGGVGQAEREIIRADFLQRPAARLVAQPECWKFGTNLSGVETVIFFSLPSGLLTWQQVCERTVDLTTKNSLFIISLLAANTVDEAILESLYAKEDRQKSLERIRRGIIARQSAARV